MQTNRGTLFLYGLLLLFAGLQLHFFESFTLTEQASKFYYEKIEPEAQQQSFQGFFAASTPFSFGQKILKHPKWLCWPFISVAAVLIFQSFIMKKSESNHD